MESDDPLQIAHWFIKTYGIDASAHAHVRAMEYFEAKNEVELSFWSRVLHYIINLNEVTPSPGDVAH